MPASLRPSISSAFPLCFRSLAIAFGLLLPLAPAWALTNFTVGTFNVEGYIVAAGSNRQIKSPESRAKVRESIRALNADVLALQEMGPLPALHELRENLKREGLDYPYWEHVSGWDTNIHVAVLSRLPIVARRPHTNETFLLQGRRLHVTRGFAEVDLQVSANYRFTLLAAHLKSRRQSSVADESDMREQEALILREIVEARLKANPSANLIVLGDLNDVKDARSTRALIGRGRAALVDTRPAERNGDNLPASQPGYSPRNVTWTHYYGKEDTYSRIDYILISQGLAREWIANGTYVLGLPNWGLASDHRPIIANFAAEDR
jgi:endonuclease/exonuclease/phosphatase family metal-dependent hydrolase